VGGGGVNLADLRVALADRISTIPNTQGIAYPADQIAAGNNTWITIAPAQDYIDFHEAFAGGLAYVRYTLTVWVPMVDARSAFNRVDALLSSGTGEAKSLIDALMNEDRTYGGLSFDVVVDTASNIRAEMGQGEARYLCADVDLRVLVGRI
jgi:hypothetical protein